MHKEDKLKLEYNFVLEKVNKIYNFIEEKSKLDKTYVDSSLFQKHTEKLAEGAAKLDHIIDKIKTYNEYNILNGFKI